MSKIAGVILAGGKSLRMGENKALLSWRGARLIDYVAEVLCGAGIVDIYVSGEISGYKNIPDKLPHKGPVGGICASVEFLQQEHKQVLFVAVDMPLLSSNLIVSLLDIDDGFEAKYFQKNPLPCLVHLTPKTLNYTKNIAGKKECSVKKYLSGLEVRELSLSADFARAMANTNTQEEWKVVSDEYPY